MLSALYGKAGVKASVQNPVPLRFVDTPDTQVCCYAATNPRLRLHDTVTECVSMLQDSNLQPQWDHLLKVTNDPALVAMLQRLLNFDPTKRSTAAEVLHDPYLASVEGSPPDNWWVPAVQDTPLNSSLMHGLQLPLLPEMGAVEGLQPVPGMGSVYWRPCSASFCVTETGAIHRYVLKAYTVPHSWQHCLDNAWLEYDNQTSEADITVVCCQACRLSLLQRVCLLLLTYFCNSCMMFGCNVCYCCCCRAWAVDSKSGWQHCMLKVAPLRPVLDPDVPIEGDPKTILQLAALINSGTSACLSTKGLAGIPDMECAFSEDVHYTLFRCVLSTELHHSDSNATADCRLK